MIGIPAWKTGDNSFGVTAPYYEYIESLGFDVKILSVGEYDPDIDLLLLPGGSDVDPIRYNQRPGVYTSKSNVHLEYFDKYILPEYIENETPIFGICRGFQSLAIQFGGNIDQDIKGHSKSTKSRDELVNKTYINEELNKSFRKSVHEFVAKNKHAKKLEDVNSIHHQAVVDTGEFEIIAYEEDGTIEAIQHPELPIAGVQYHPEELIGTELLSIFLIDNLLKFKTEDYLSVESQLEEYES